MSDRDAAALRQAAEGSPGGGRYFNYRPPLGPSRPFDQDFAVEIIRKSPTILHPFPLRSPSQRQDGQGVAPVSPVRRRCEARDGLHPQNGLLDGAATSPLHGSACSLL